MRIEFTADVSELDILQEANRKGRIDSSGLTLAARRPKPPGWTGC